MGKWLPDTKVLSGGVTALIIWLLMTFIPDTAPEEAGEIAALIGFLVSYFAPQPVKEVIKKFDTDLKEHFKKE